MPHPDTFEGQTLLFGASGRAHVPTEPGPPVIVDVCPLEELPPGSMKLIAAGPITLGVYNLDGRLCAIEDRCSHDDGPLVEGDWEPDEGVVICPRHGSRFDICSGRALTLPAYLPVPTFPVRVEDGMVKVEVEVAS